MEPQQCRRSALGAAFFLFVLAGSVQSAAAYEVFDNGKLRVGTGAQASVNTNGNLQQPFYYDSVAAQWYKLTYSSYPLDNAIGIDGDGTSEWNINGSIVENSALSGQVLDVSGFTLTSGSKGYGTIVSTGTVNIGGKLLELRNTYSLGANQSFIKIVTRLRNISGSTVGNVRVWVGTRDDWVGTTDGPTKQRGNLVNGAFVKNTNTAAQASALQIFSGATGVLFYSTSPKAHTSINVCCSFSNAYQDDPAVSSTELTGDGSYALFVRMDDLANGASEEFTWYYAAGELANLGDIVNEVSQAVQNNTVTATAGSGGTISPASSQVATGATTSFTVTPNSGYSISTVQGCGGSLNGNTYTTGAITTACTVTASFSINTYSITASAGVGGSISPGSATVNHGSTTAFTVTPLTGYSIASVQGCGGSLTGNTFTTGAITAACSVTASFALNSYSVTATAGVGGAVSPGAATVNHGSSTSFTVTPAVGYSVATVQGCSGTLNGNTYTTGTITGACAITATFSLNSYLVSATAGNGGSISPASTSVNHASTASFVVTPSSGYGIASVTGCGGALNGNTYTTAPISGPCSISAQFSMTRPRFEPAAPSAYNLQAAALTTALPQDVAPQAFDYQGSALTVTLVGGATRFEPGQHVLTWRAVDSRGVASTVEQILRVWPTVSMGKDVTLGYRQGNSGSFRIVLNGMSPVYPFAVDYTVSGSSVGHDLQSGRTEFTAGELEKEIYFAVLQTPAAGTPDQQMQVKLAGDLNRGDREQLTVTLTSTNAPPRVTVVATQNGQSVPAFGRGDGAVTLQAQVEDPNSNDTHTYQWFSPQGASVTTNNGMLTLQANSLAAGIHRFEVLVTDSGTPALSTRGILDIVLVQDAPILPSGAQGWADNGLPDHPDYNPPGRNVLPERSGELHHFIVEGDPGVRMKLGPYALQASRSQAELTTGAGSGLGSDTIDNVGGYFDFTVDELPQAGQSVNVVLPQRAPIPQNAVYRKFSSATRTWGNFVQNGTNALASAPGAEGYCPPPNSDQYRAGLNAGDWCVRLTISDGGPNDDDRQINGSVVDPGGVASLTSVTVTTTGSGSSNGGGGGGAMDLTMLLLGMLALISRRSSMAPRIVLSFCALAVSVPAAAAEREWSWTTAVDHLYVGAQGAQVYGETSENDLNARLTGAGYAATASYDDRSRTGWRLFAGYQWNQNFETQFGYTDLGKVVATFTGNVVSVEEFMRTANRLHPRSADGWELSFLGRFPLTQRWAVTGRGGLFRWDSSYRSFDEVADSDRLKDHGLQPVLGVGLALSLMKQLELNAEWTHYKVDREDIQFAGVGLVYRLRAR